MREPRRLLCLRGERRLLQWSIMRRLLLVLLVLLVRLPDRRLRRMRKVLLRVDEGRLLRLLHVLRLLVLRI